MTLDCTTCGACCASPPETARLYKLGPVDIEKDGHLPRYVRRNWIVQTRKGVHLKVLVDDAGGERCFALIGDVGKRASCRIYDRRPTACVAFEVGSELCLRKRSEAGLPTSDGAPLRRP
jgi:Fe-S-cluster containining protein